MKTEFKSIEAVKFLDSSYKEGFVSVHLQQQVNTYYPTTKISSSLSDNPFSNDVEYGEPFPTTRNTIIYVPEGTSLEEVTEKVKNGKIYRILSLDTILSDNDEAAIEAKLRSQDDFALKQLVRNAEGEVVLFHNFPQYRRLAFSLDSEKSDVDTREKDEIEGKTYLSAVIVSEIEDKISSVQTV